MFQREIYIKRREQLRGKIKSGLLLFVGNDESPMNYAANTYRFRQDSTFLYYFGLSQAGLAGIIDVDENQDILFGYKFALEDIIWMGPQKSLQERGEQTGVKITHEQNKLREFIQNALKKGRNIHILPSYREEHDSKIQFLFDMDKEKIEQLISEELIRAIVDQRSVKSSEEIEQVEKAHAITNKMHVQTMQMAKPGLYEYEIAGFMEGLALSHSGSLAFPSIVSIHGETLHNPFHGNLLKEGDMLLNDSGAETEMGYAADITRTIPVSGKFSQRQKEIYEIVLRAQMEAIDAIKPGIKYIEVHTLASKLIAYGLKELQLMKGDIEQAVKDGAHALFFPHGLGHMLGLDVHDMENLGEDYVGYDEKTQRSKQFGLAYLRLAKMLQPGYILTVEPGIYFIPQLIEQWSGEKKFTQFINYNLLEKYKDFGGIRIEDDVLVTETGNKVLGKLIPKLISQVEEICQI
jgi:Xaa-Pro dipeptidase